MQPSSPLLLALARHNRQFAYPKAMNESSATNAEFIALQQQVAGRYSLDRELGRGGMGIVLLARDVALDRLVAIKLLPPKLAIDADLRERFLREARTAAGLSHPNIVPIHAVEEHGDIVFFVMGYVDGETLRQRVERAGPHYLRRSCPSHSGGGLGSRPCTRQEHRAPRHKAGQHPARQGDRSRDGDRLWHRTRDGREGPHDGR